MSSVLAPQRLLWLLRKEPATLWAAEASDLALLGPAAPWLLTDDALTRLAEEEPRFGRLPRPFCPRLPDEAGSCGLVYAAADPCAFPCLRPAFLLPVQWRQGALHDPALPARLTGLADRVVKQLDLIGAWSIHRQAPFDHLNLSPFDDQLEHESGWASLAGGLLVLVRGGRPRPDVWATGRWDGDAGVIRVGGLDAKLDLAHRWGATTVFVPESQKEPATGMTLGPIYRGLRKPEEALSDYLAALEAEPLPGAPRNERVNFYLRLPAASERAVAFYRTHFLPDIVDDRHRQIEEDYPEWAPTHLVTVVSHNPELIEIAARALGVRACLLLHTADQKDRQKAVAQDLRAAGIEEVSAGEFVEKEAMASRMANLIEAFAGKVPAEALVFDMTPGRKTMTLALEQLARRYRPRSWLIYLWHALEKGRVVPFEEKLERWRAVGADGPFLLPEQR